jgi:hypothetical protein
MGCILKLSSLGTVIFWLTTLSRYSYLSARSLKPATFKQRLQSPEFLEGSGCWMRTVCVVGVLGERVGAVQPRQNLRQDKPSQQTAGAF